MQTTEPAGRGQCNRSPGEPQRRRRREGKGISEAVAFPGKGKALSEQLRGRAGCAAGDAKQGTCRLALHLVSVQKAQTRCWGQGIEMALAMFEHILQSSGTRYFFFFFLFQLHVFFIFIFEQ